MKRVACVSVVALAVLSIGAANLLSQPAAVSEPLFDLGAEVPDAPVRPAENQRQPFANLSEFAQKIPNATRGTQAEYLRLQLRELMAAKVKDMTLEELREAHRQYSAPAEEEIEAAIDRLRGVANTYPETIYAAEAKAAIRELTRRQRAPAGYSKPRSPSPLRQPLPFQTSDLLMSPAIRKSQPPRSW